MRLRTAVASEAETLDRIALAAKAHWGYSDQDMERWRPELQTSAASIGAWPTFVAEAEGTAIAFAQLDPTRDPWELVSLWVQPEHMGLGIGRQLLRKALTSAASAGQRCIVIDSDPNALGFYVACGARQIGSVPAPLLGKPDRIRPQLELATRGA